MAKKKKVAKKKAAPKKAVKKGRQEEGRQEEGRQGDCRQEVGQAQEEVGRLRHLRWPPHPVAQFDLDEKEPSGYLSLDGSMI